MVRTSACAIWESSKAKLDAQAERQRRSVKPDKLEPKPAETHLMSTSSFRRFASVVALFLVASTSLVHAQDSNPEAAAVASVVHEFHAALVAADVQAVSRLLAPDAVILEGGDRENRSEYLQHHLQADIQFAQAVPTRHSKIDVTIVGDVAWAISTGVTQGMYQSKPLNLVGAELMVLTKTSAAWVIRTIHWSSRKSK